MRIEVVPVRCHELIGRSKGAELAGRRSRWILYVTASPVNVRLQVLATCLARGRK
jgi:hypothetical protein